MWMKYRKMWISFLLSILFILGMFLIGSSCAPTSKVEKLGNDCEITEISSRIWRITSTEHDPWEVPKNLYLCLSSLEDFFKIVQIIPIQYYDSTSPYTGELIVIVEVKEKESD